MYISSNLSVSVILSSLRINLIRVVPRSYEACQWYSGNTPHNRSPPSEWIRGIAVPLQYPGVTNLAAVGWHADDRGSWVYCFKTNSEDNYDQAVWTAE